MRSYPVGLAVFLLCSCGDGDEVSALVDLGSTPIEEVGLTFPEVLSDVSDDPDLAPPIDAGAEAASPGLPDDTQSSDGLDEPDVVIEDVPPPEELPLPSPCGPQMALVADSFCIDRFEAALEEEISPGVWQPASPYLTIGDRVVRAVPAAGVVPQGYISGAEAAEACALAGKRLCSSAEWLQACRGPEEQLFPYGSTHLAGACNDDYSGGHPVVDFFGTNEGIWDGGHMNDPGINQQEGTVAAGGVFAECLSAWGVYDLHGNLHEWVDDATGVFRGGFYADASINGAGCTYKTGAHAPAYHDYSTGFRCCSDL